MYSICFRFLEDKHGQLLPRGLVGLHAYSIFIVPTFGNLSTSSKFRVISQSDPRIYLYDMGAYYEVFESFLDLLRFFKVNCFRRA